MRQTNVSGGRTMAGKRGQAMVETVIAVLVVTSVFLLLFRLSQTLTGKILVQHAALRVARARAVGMNDFVCTKTARVATIPVARKRTWPEDETFTPAMEVARTGVYMATADEAIARGVLEYEGWSTLIVDPQAGAPAKVSLEVKPMDDMAAFRLEGEAEVENNFSLYMNDGGR